MTSPDSNTNQTALAYADLVTMAGASAATRVRRHSEPRRWDYTYAVELCGLGVYIDDVSFDALAGGQENCGG